MFADLGEEQAEHKAPAVGISMYDNLPRKQQQTSSLKRAAQPDTESIPAKKPKPSRTAVLPAFIVTLAAAEDKGTRHEMEDIAVMHLDTRPDADCPWRWAQCRTLQVCNFHRGNDQCGLAASTLIHID